MGMTHLKMVAGFVFEINV